MNHYIIDGNNLIGKIRSLQKLQDKDKHSSREGLINIINRYFANKKVKLTLHLDGFSNYPLHLFSGEIIYSDKKSSDQMIRQEIDRSPNPKLIILISSDNDLINYAKVNSCKIIKSEELVREIENTSSIDEESEKLKQLEKQKDEFLKLFDNSLE